MIRSSEDQISAFHESGHVIISQIINVPVEYATIAGKPHIDLSLQGILKIALSDGHRAVFFLAGTILHKYYFPDEPAINKKDESLLWGLSANRRKYYTDFINHHLADPMVRKKIEDLADRLIIEISISF
jgi:hypothetical protein